MPGVSGRPGGRGPVERAGERFGELSAGVIGAVSGLLVDARWRVATTGAIALSVLVVAVSRRGVDRGRPATGTR